MCLSKKGESRMTNMSALFKDLTPEEEPPFRDWAWENWKPHTKPEEIWHPVVQDEWHTIDKFAGDVIQQFEGIAPDLEAGSDDGTLGNPEACADLILSTMKETTPYLIFRSKVEPGQSRIDFVVKLIKEYF